MLLRAKWAGAAGGWGGAAGGGGGENVQWHSWSQERTSVHGSPSSRSLLRLSLGQLLHWTISWPSALGRDLHGIFQPFPSLLAFTVPSRIDLKPPKPLFCFLALCDPLYGPAELHSQAACPRFPIHSQPVRSRLRKAFQSITHPMSACRLSHWDEQLSWREAERGWKIGWKNIKAQRSLEAARQHDPVVLGRLGWSFRLTAGAA